MAGINVDCVGDNSWFIGVGTESDDHAEIGYGIDCVIGKNGANH